MFFQVGKWERRVENCEVVAYVGRELGLRKFSLDTVLGDLGRLQV